METCFLPYVNLPPGPPASPASPCAAAVHGRGDGASQGAGARPRTRPRHRLLHQPLQALCVRGDAQHGGGGQCAGTERHPAAGAPHTGARVRVGEAAGGFMAAPCCALPCCAVAVLYRAATCYGTHVLHCSSLLRLLNLLRCCAALCCRYGGPLSLTTRRPPGTAPSSLRSTLTGRQWQPCAGRRAWAALLLALVLLLARRRQRPSSPRCLRAYTSQVGGRAVACSGGGMQLSEVFGGSAIVKLAVLSCTSLPVLSTLSFSRIP